MAMPARATQQSRLPLPNLWRRKGIRMLCLPTLFIVAAVLVLLWWFFSQFFRSPAGRIVMMLALLVIGTGLVAQAIADPINGIPYGGYIGFICLLLGCVQLGLIVWSIVTSERQKQAEETSKNRLEHLQMSGMLLPVPNLPAPPAWMTRDELLREEELARTMSHVAWGERPQFSAEEMWRVFDHAMGLLGQADAGDRRALEDATKLLMVTPPPCCYIGGAEVLLRLARRGEGQYYPALLLQGLQLIAQAQYYDPIQPDALLARIRLLAASGAGDWLSLAEQTLALLQQTAPGHPGIPEAEQVIRTRQG